MFDTLKKMFFFDDRVTTPVEKVGTVEEPKISEPVISFVKVFKKNPRRFKITITYETSKDVYRSVPYYTDQPNSFSTPISSSLYQITDREKGNYFVVRQITYLKTSARQHQIERTESYHYESASKNLAWITPDELEYALAEIIQFLKERAVERRNRLDRIRRNKYIRHYCQ